MKMIEDPEKEVEDKAYVLTPPVPAIQDPSVPGQLNLIIPYQLVFHSYHLSPES